MVLWSSHLMLQQKEFCRPTMEPKCLEQSKLLGSIGHLLETFRAQYPSVRGAKVVTDPNTGRSKGYGFVKFSDETERNRAMTEMNGVYCSTRPMRISAATPKKTSAIPQLYPTAKAIYPMPYTMPTVPVFPTDNDVTNTTIYIGSLDPNVSEDELKQIFGQFGELVSVKIPPGRGCGFVQFATRASAEEAIQRLQGTMIGQQPARLSWGRGMNKPDQPGSWGLQGDSSQWGSSYYGYGPGYDAYAYMATNDPSLYAYSGYAGYAQYPQQTEGVQDVATMMGSFPSVEHRDETFDPLAPPDVDKLNAAYLSVHESAMVGRPLWLRSSFSSQPA